MIIGATVDLLSATVPDDTDATHPIQSTSKPPCFGFDSLLDVNIALQLQEQYPVGSAVHCEFCPQVALFLP
eukprot:6473219-Amphidinium_carterae.1